MTLRTIKADDACYPRRLREQMGAAAPDPLSALGNVDLLALPSMALFCSVRCPGHAILATYDQVARWRDAGQCVIGGFHSPLELECLRILLRGTSPIILCLARGMVRRVPVTPVDCRPAFAEGRLLLVSPFPVGWRRKSSEMAMLRNCVVAALAAAVTVAHAAPASKVEALSLELLDAGKPLYTFDHPGNRVLVNGGASLLKPN